MRTMFVVFALLLVCVTASAEPAVTFGVKAAEGYAYLATEYPGLRIIDVTDPVAPVEVSQCLPEDHAYGVAVTGNYAYVVDSYGLRIIDVTNRQNPSEIGSVNLPWTSDDEISRSVAVAGGYAYVAEASSHWRLTESKRQRCDNSVNPTAGRYCEL